LLLPGRSGGSRLAEAPGTWNDNDTSFREASAGKDHEVLVIWLQPSVVSVAVTPWGRPATVKSVAVGKVVPAVGAIEIV
jgi:hypothetical protein